MPCVIDWNEWLTVTTIAALGIMSPGPSFAIILKNSLYQGRRSGIYTAAGVATGDILVVLMNIFGLTLLITQVPMAFTIIKILGAVYLLWLGLRSLQSQKKDPASFDTKEHTNHRNDFWTGFIVVLFNVKAWVFCMSLFAVVVRVEAALGLKLFYALWLATISFSWFCVVALFLTDKRLRLRLIGQVHWLERITGIFLIFVAIQLLMSEPLEGFL